MSEKEKKRVLVTGASGFIGGAVAEALVQRDDREPVLALRRSPTSSPAWPPHAVVGGLAPDTDWREALQGCQAVVHCAARAHVMDDNATDPLAEYRRTNLQGTLNLARQAAEAGVARFVFLSSIKVNGEQTSSERAFTVEDEPDPIDSYGLSKHEAEKGLLALAKETGLEVVIIRPPLVYGPGVKANFASMMRWLDKGVPLPLGSIPNRRSLVARANLVDLILTCLDHPAAANQVFLASDGEDLSTTELLCQLGQALGRPARLLPVPAGLLVGSASLLGKKAVAQRLCGSLRVDISKARERLGWAPPVTVDQALLETARAYQEGPPGAR
ncbi:SDR family oxidoreductase [Chromohalobacter sp. 296-RDG]|uniref:UDP-glucose 4-epimerase family protein n=1 Tax=Chromohalobacter sp. 296-RDG TaxID=2994062 RepID=UPI0024684A55|nr:SDR family oxidoreductase [Chromohalobacter sp. 296-RDG]